MLPLPTLLSAALVAFTIEADNEVERVSAHSTTTGEGNGGPWLVSEYMWANVLRHLPAEGPTTTSELVARSRTERHNLNGLQRWGYLRVKRESPETTVRLTRWGRMANTTWAPVPALIEKRWTDRFGAAAVVALRSHLSDVVACTGRQLPHYLPMIFPAQGGRTEVFSTTGPTTPDDSSAADPDLSALLSRALHAFTIDFEAQTKMSLAMASNTLRVLNETGIRVRDLPALSGVSKEAQQMCLGFYERHGRVALMPDPEKSRGKVARLTPEGRQLQSKYRRLLHDVEAVWESAHGDNLRGLRAALELIVGPSPAAEHSPLFTGLDPPPGCWREKLARPRTLPHYPMVLHRGGYPDGS